MADRKLTAGILNLPATARQDLARQAEEFERFKQADYLRKMGEQGMGLAKSVARGVPQMATGLVDLASMPFEAAGLTKPGAYGTTKWLEESGYLPPPQEGFLNQTAELLSGGFDPSDFVTKGAPLLMGIGKTVWHGSPHTFDKFDLSKIGTGEGAQAYGHGLYLAESPNVATEYSKMEGMVQPPPRRTFQGAELTPGTPEYHAGTLLERSTLPAAKKEVAGWIKEAETWPAARMADPREMEVLAGWQKTLDTLNQTAKKSDFSVAPGGNLYKVDLPDEQIAKMLDWDKPLSEQPDIQQTFINQIVESRRGNPEQAVAFLEGKTAGEAYGILSGRNNQEATSQALLERGIPGIQYLDQASRGAGDGTRNYVVFSDEIPQILERNGTPLGNALRKPQEMPISDLKLNEYGSAIAQSTFNKDKTYIHQNKNPISIVKLPNGEPYVLDGYHRIEQAKRAGQENIQVKELPLTEDIKQMLINDKVLGQE